MGKQMSGTTLKSTSIGPLCDSHFSITAGKSSSVSHRTDSMPQACASFTKSGLTFSELMYLPSKKSRCQIATICCLASFMIAILTGRLYLTIVCRSMLVMLNEPSPSNRIVRASGLATCVPMANGKPAPITPNDPLLIMLLGFLQRMNWQAIIWWFPTPVQMKTSLESIRPFFCRALFVASMTICVLSLLCGGFTYPCGCCSFHVLHWATHSSRADLSSMSRCGSRAVSACSASAQIATVGRMTFPKVVRSMLMWMMPPAPVSSAALAFGAYLSITPVVRSSKRLPTATMQSEFWMAKFAYAEPCIPNMCSDNGSISSKTPIAWIVVVTGMFAL
mmetsp:Transcript_39471/g.78571  ORF Transcript_39471/g.78571 Transcript_39471/m.78571 type:complete len:334 (-) Transcript_39471:732-1733(-)